jgi:YbgC/YbaW family acyl-CoA thioester hydrolase
MRARGLVYRDVEYDEKIALPVAAAELRYRRPARFDEELDVCVGVNELRPASIRFGYEIVRDGELVCEARVTLACVCLPEGRPVRLPERLRTALSD